MRRQGILAYRYLSIEKQTLFMIGKYSLAQKTTPLLLRFGREVTMTHV